MAGRRRLRPTLMGIALTGAAVLAVAPAVFAGGGPAAAARELSRLEPTYGFHGPHGDTPANAALDRLRLRRCAAPAFRRAHPSRCPGPAALRRRRGATLLEGGVAGVEGRWGAPFAIRTVGMHATLLPTGKVLWLSTTTEDGGGEAILWDPATGARRRVDPPDVTYPDGRRMPANLFCSGHAQLADGRLLVAGGNLAFTRGDGPGEGWKGSTWLFTFNPWSERWTRQRADMRSGRWYPTVTTLPDGRALITGGWDESGDLHANTDMEVFTPSPDMDGADGTVRVVGQRPYAQLYPHMFVLPSTTAAGRGGDKVLMAGPAGRYPATAGILDTRTWQWTRVPFAPTTREFGAAVLVPGGPSGPREVMMIGGSDRPHGESRGTATTAVLDLDAPGAGFRAGPALNAGRSHVNAVLLPDESVLAVGGGAGVVDGSIYADPVFTAERYTPGTGWRTMAAQAEPRTYHAVGLLLPDGRVLSNGDDRSTHWPLEARTAELYSPPYLFRGPLPRIASAPEAAPYGVSLAVTSPDASRVAKAVLVRPSSVTHVTDMDQRTVELELAREAAGLRLRTPADGSIAPPGWYMLFLVDEAGVPSEARWLRLDPAAPVPPALPVVPRTDPPAPPATAPGGDVPRGRDPSGTGAGRVLARPDRRAPRVALRATARQGGGRVVVRAVVRSDEAARSALRLLGPWRPSPSRRVTLRAGRDAVVVVAGAGAAPRVRVELRATDAAGNTALSRRVLTVLPGRPAR